MVCLDFLYLCSSGISPIKFESAEIHPLPLFRSTLRLDDLPNSLLVTIVVVIGTAAANEIQLSDHVAIVPPDILCLRHIRQVLHVAVGVVPVSDRLPMVAARPRLPQTIACWLDGVIKGIQIIARPTADASFVFHLRDVSCR